MMKSNLLRIALCAVCLSALITAQKPVPAFYPVVPNDATAIRIAQAVLIPKLGEEEVGKRSFKARNVGDAWIVDATVVVPPGVYLKGGVSHVTIEKSDGRILELYSEK